MKQTAVEWFYDQITRTYWDYLTTERQNELFQQAKQMEKQQMEKIAGDLWNEGANYVSNVKTKYESFEQYYHENFKK